MEPYQSWGRYPRVTPKRVVKTYWPNDTIEFKSSEDSWLPFGNGRSYGDICLNQDGVLLDMRPLHRFISFDEKRGILRCEAGVTFSEILKVIVPRGWFLPVTPGTQYVSVGGAIANDVHGKNHHCAGTFGAHVRSFEIVRSSGERFFCSLDQNSDLFSATIGGLGLTGAIVWAEIQLKPVAGPWIVTERFRFHNLDEFFDLSAQGDENFEYTVAWIDCFTQKPKLGRGIFIRGNHQPEQFPRSDWPKFSKSVRIPFNVRPLLLHPFVLKWFNSLYFYSSPTSPLQALEPYDRFFYPLDGIQNFNRLYGSSGFLQYQCVIPPPHHKEGTHELLERIQKSRQGSSLAVLKQFGSRISPGLLSFPRLGTTLALDFPYQGQKTLDLLSSLDDVVSTLGGAVYPAKDARMSPAHFRLYFPKWEEFMQFIDPKFSSSFWRRVNKTSPISSPSPTTPNDYSLSDLQNNEELVEVRQ